jgi:hypothetical protein
MYCTQLLEWAPRVVRANGRPHQSDWRDTET